MFLTFACGLEAMTAVNRSTRSGGDLLNFGIAGFSGIASSILLVSQPRSRRSSTGASSSSEASVIGSSTSWTWAIPSPA